MKLIPNYMFHIFIQKNLTFLECFPSQAQGANLHTIHISFGHAGKNNQRIRRKVTQPKLTSHIIHLPVLCLIAHTCSLSTAYPLCKSSDLMYILLMVVWEPFKCCLSTKGSSHTVCPILQKQVRRNIILCTLWSIKDLIDEGPEENISWGTTTCTLVPNANIPQNNSSKQNFVLQ